MNKQIKSAVFLGGMLQAVAGYAAVDINFSSDGGVQFGGTVTAGTFSFTDGGFLSVPWQSYSTVVQNASDPGTYFASVSGTFHMGAIQDNYSGAQYYAPITTPTGNTITIQNHTTGSTVVGDVNWTFIEQENGSHGTAKGSLILGGYNVTGLHYTTPGNTDGILDQYISTYTGHGYLSASLTLNSGDTLKTLVAGTSSSGFVGSYNLNFQAPPPPVPEPTTMVAGFAALGIVGLLRRSRK
jgi:hypothetical protein